MRRAPEKQVSRVQTICPVFVLLLGIAGSAWAQNVTAIEAPSHRFFDRQNTSAFVALGGLITIDAVHTQSMLQTNRYIEADPLARALVNKGWPGQLAASGIGCGSALGISYIFHRTGHHKIERWATWLMVAGESGNDIRNLLLP